MHGAPLRGKRGVVQRYGETNRDLQATLESEGAEVIEIVTYRWGLPEDTTPLLRLIDALGRDEIDLVAFTTASQASKLFRRRAIRRQRGVAPAKSWPNVDRFDRPGVQRRASQVRRKGRYRSTTAEARAVYRRDQRGVVRPTSSGQLLTRGVPARTPAVVAKALSQGYRLISSGRLALATNGKSPRGCFPFRSSRQPPMADTMQLSHFAGDGVSPSHVEDLSPQARQCGAALPER
jgi:hypothetical protein